MAAALLMMNMHGAVMASDCDRTIFRYSEKIPFAIMVDPRSELPWEEIIMEYQAKRSISHEMSFKDCATNFREYLTDLLKSKDNETQKNESDRQVICIGYDSHSIFPKASIITTAITARGFMTNHLVEIGNNSKSVFLQTLGNCENIRILLGGMSDDLSQKIRELFFNKISDIVGEKDSARFINDFGNYIKEQLDLMQEDTKVLDAISLFTIKDMVKMAENLIETEGLLNSDSSSISPTREIGIVTLAEGFVYIKHSLYGA
jgi:hypothetical protein